MTAYHDRRMAGHYDRPASPAAIDATEAAVQRAQQLEVDVATVKGTGKDGRVTAADVIAAAEALAVTTDVQADTAYLSDATYTAVPE